MVFPVVMYGCESWTIKKAEQGIIGAFELCCWRKLLRVPWTARRSNQSILKEISPECSLQGLMLKLTQLSVWTTSDCRVKSLLDPLNHKTWETQLCCVLSHSVVSDSLRPHGLQHARPPCSSSTSRVYSDSCPLSQWCHPTISSSVVPVSSCLQSSPVSGPFPMSQLFTSGGQNIGVSASASVLPMNIQDWFPLGTWIQITAMVGFWE